jgi:hypothetical protein
MAVYHSQETEGIACTSGTSVTLQQLRRGLAAGPPAKIIQWGVSFDGNAVTSNTTPAKVKLERQTTAGTMTEVGRGFKYDSGVTDSICSWRRKATAEPTAGDVVEMHHVPVTGGVLVIQYPLGREPKLQANERMGIVVQAQVGSAASALAHIVWEE